MKMNRSNICHRMMVCLIASCLVTLFCCAMIASKLRATAVGSVHGGIRESIFSNLNDTGIHINLHSDLKSIGRIIIFHPSQGVTGGPAALNYLHCALVNAGFNAFMHTPNYHYISTNCSRPISDDFAPSSKDLIIVPENAFIEKFPQWREHGARVLVYMLGLHVPLVEQHRTDVIWAPSSTYTRDIFLATGKQVLFAPLEQRLYEMQKKDASVQRRENPYVHLKNKENLIFLDNDFVFPSSLRRSLELLPLKPPVTFKVLSNIHYSEVHVWFQRAKVIIDLGLPGVERINYEGALFDGIILVANTLNGADPNDFPVPTQFKLDTRNETQMFEIIKGMLVLKPNSFRPVVIKRGSARRPSNIDQAGRWKF